MNNPILDKKGAANLYEVLKAVSHPVCLLIIEHLQKVGTVTVKEIYKPLDLEQSQTSFHLKYLRDSDVVKSDRDGKSVHYSLNYKMIERINKACANFSSISK